MLVGYQDYISAIFSTSEHNTLWSFFEVSENFFEYIIKVEELIHKLGIKTKVMNMKLS